VIGFIFFFFLSPILYAYVSISKDDKRTDYPGKEIAIKTQHAWDQQFKSKINVVYGNEWNAGNLSYHLKSRPKWYSHSAAFVDKSFADFIETIGKDGLIIVNGECTDGVSFTIESNKICMYGDR
jgi:hypothetical protein